MNICEGRDSSVNEMINYQKFEVEITRSLSRNGLRWPARGEATSEANLGCNRAYSDLRGLSWSEAARVLELGTRLIERLEAASDSDEEYDLIADELYEDDEGLFGLDIGVASTAIALSAAGCIPCSSCNAGAYGGSHYEQYPVVAFFAKPPQVDLLLRCAEEANVGIENDASGIVTAYADDIRNMRVFANALIRDKTLFRTVARTRVANVDDEIERASPRNDEGGQLNLPLD